MGRFFGQLHGKASGLTQLRETRFSQENPNLLTGATYRRRLPPSTALLSSNSSSPSLNPVVAVALHIRRLHVLRDTDPLILEL
ncbi:hypothetical protein PIB30_073278 [Stylosanthes scabra]|uniref:Uncharacterized protein n=1 Tax=Stylosanthes scabra TaxID=79078 RepID=A0ABU6XMR7_9FABA|nr:hypothetical protein [Stylosanthes scabra]